MARRLSPLLALVLFVFLLAQNQTITRSIRSAFRDGTPPDVFLERYPQLADLARTDEVKELPHLQIRIRQRELEKLVERRDLAIKEGYLYSGDDDYVSVRLRFGKQRARAKLRLKGDFTDQLKTTSGLSASRYAVIRRSWECGSSPSSHPKPAAISPNGPPTS